MPQPPDDARTVPVWVIVDAPADQRPGWYTAQLQLAANDRRFEVPVQVLVTDLAMPDPKDFNSLVGMTQSPDILAQDYGVEVWSEEHFALLDQAYRLLGQVGNDVLHVPVIWGSASPVARDWVGTGGDRSTWHTPMIRWVRTERGLEPDFTIFNRVLETWVRHCGPPRAIALYVWDASCAAEMADAYEGRRIPSRLYEPKRPLLVSLLDRQTGEVSDLEAPLYDAEGAEAFWKPLLDGVRGIVVERGWSDRIIMLGQGGDMRAGQRTGEIFREWAPYARWSICGHFSGDPPPAEDGRMIATGALDVGLKEIPQISGDRGMSAEQLERHLTNPRSFLEMSTNRWLHEPGSPPLAFRTIPVINDGTTRLGLDFWMPEQGRRMRNSSFFTIVNHMVVRGPEGPIPTVRFQMLREGVQEQEVRVMLVREYLKLPEDQREADRALIDEFRVRIGHGSRYLGQQELCFDWPGHIAAIQARIVELRGGEPTARWEQPPR